MDFHNQYAIVGKIGVGSSASVCSIRRLVDGQLFAAKIFSKKQL